MPKVTQNATLCDRKPQKGGTEVGNKCCECGATLPEDREYRKCDECFERDERELASPSRPDEGKVGFRGRCFGCLQVRFLRDRMWCSECRRSDQEIHDSWLQQGN